MVHKASIIPGLSQFLDETVLSHYPPTSMKRILAAGALALYLKQNTNIVDTILNNPLFASLKLSTPDGLINLEAVRDIYKSEIHKAGYMRVTFPMLGDVDFTADDLDRLYAIIMSIEGQLSNQTPQMYGGLINT
jgi:hypothetical protein